MSADEVFPSRAGRLSAASFHPMPGHEVSPTGKSGKWMCIEDWHCIGPLPSPGRQNLDKKFPPESV